MGDGWEGLDLDNIFEVESEVEAWVVCWEGKREDVKTSSGLDLDAGWINVYI